MVSTITTKISCSTLYYGESPTYALNGEQFFEFIICTWQYWLHVYEQYYTGDDPTKVCLIAVYAMYSEILKLFFATSIHVQTMESPVTLSAQRNYLQVPEIQPYFNKHTFIE